MFNKNLIDLLVVEVFVFNIFKLYFWILILVIFFNFLVVLIFCCVYVGDLKSKLFEIIVDNIKLVILGLILKLCFLNILYKIVVV